MPSPAVQTIKEVYDAVARRDILRIFSTLSPDVEIMQSTELPWGGTFRGHDGAREFFARLTLHLNSTVVVERFIDAIDHVAVIGRTQGKVNGTGAVYDVPIAHIWHVRDGLVQRAQFFVDTPAMLHALGASGAAVQD